MKFKFITVIVCLLFLLVPITSQEIDSLSSEVIIKNNGTLEIHDLLNISLTDDSVIYLNIIPVYDLVIKSKYNNLNYSYSTDTLSIDISNISLDNNTLSLEIIYLTDYFTNKDGDQWNVSYFPLFKEEISNLKLTFPKLTEISDLSVDISNVNIENNQFVLNLEDISELDASYTINAQKLKKDRKSIIPFIILIIIILIGGGLFYYFKLKPKKKKQSNNNLLLGLNENEQKIIKLLLKDNGVSQKKIAFRLFLPKGTISRNIQKLETKGYVEIKKYGVTNKVFLGKIFKK